MCDSWRWSRETGPRVGVFQDERRLTCLEMKGGSRLKRRDTQKGVASLGDPPQGLCVGKSIKMAAECTGLLSGCTGCYDANCKQWGGTPTALVLL